jgi:hypothetical protein
MTGGTSERIPSQLNGYVLSKVLILSVGRL